MADSIGATPVASFEDERLAWLNEPASKSGAAPGRTLTIVPVAKRDFWARTFYGPELLHKADASALLAPAPAAEEATLSVAFTLVAKAQFDQAGVLVHIDDDTWVKAGIEFCDRVPRLSVVVTNGGYSDWSTQMVPFLDLRLRVSKLLPGTAQGHALVVEAAPLEPGAAADTPGDWQLVRIASVRARDPQAAWRMGVYAAAPSVQNGCEAIFHYIRLGAKVASSHSAQI